MRPEPEQQQPQPPINNDNNEVHNRDGAMIDYHFESARRESYRNWPLAYIDPVELAAAGFYYTGENDNVQCFECHIGLRDWCRDDNPMTEHRKWQLNCRFIRNIPCGNIPMDN